MAYSLGVPVKDIIIDEGVTALGGMGVFLGTGIEHITLPSTLKTLNQTFCYSALREIVLPDSLEDIGGAFINCTNLGSVVIGSGLKNLKSSFRNCSSLTDVVFSASSSLTNISDSAFLSCTALESVVIPDGVVSIGYNAFRNCQSLSSITLPETLRSIGNLGFALCTSLKTLSIPTGVTHLDTAGFEGSGLIEISLPPGIDYIAGELFYGCTALKTVTIPAGVRWINGRAFGNCSSLKSITLPDGVEGIGTEAFRESGLMEIVIPDSVTDIGEFAFYRSKLSNIVLGAGLKNVGRSAFDWTSYPVTVTAYCALPNMGSAGLPTYSGTTVKYVLQEEFFPDWYSWFMTNGPNMVTNYRIRDEQSGQESEVAVAGDNVAGRIDTVGVAAALGLSPARYVGTNGTVRLAYEKPTVTITEFDPVAGRVAANVAPAVGSRISDALIAECIHIEWSDDLKEWAELSEMEVNADNYGETGTFRCNFDSSGHCFYRVKVTGRQ